MLKKVTGIFIVLALIILAGCSSGNNSKTATPVTHSSVKTVREADLSSKWSMKQLEIDLDDSLTIWLILADGNKVDGYYYLEDGDSVSFNITATTLVYESKAPVDKSASLTSDRFSFSATAAQGIAYGLSLGAGASANKSGNTRVFLELIYPSTGSINLPLGTK